MGDRFAKVQITSVTSNMNNNNIVNIPDEIRNEFRISADGKAFVSIRGAARLADVSHVALIKAFEGGNKSPSKLAQTLIDAGFEPGNFS